MKQEHKELLIKDLSARWPYGVECEIRQREGLSPVLHDKLTSDTIKGIQDYDWYVKPYLRPMSSMTKEERKEYEPLANRCITNSVGFIHFDAQELINWLLKNHFDFMGLIPKGLAIEVNESNNPYK